MEKQRRFKVTFIDTRYYTAEIDAANADVARKHAYELRPTDADVKFEESMVAVIQIVEV
jgi:hypothetical protein